MEHLQRFRFDWVYKPGRDNIAANALSRLPDQDVGTLLSCRFLVASLAPCRLFEASLTPYDTPTPCPLQLNMQTRDKTRSMMLPNFVSNYATKACTS